VIQSGSEKRDLEDSIVHSIRFQIAPKLAFGWPDLPHCLGRTLFILSKELFSLSRLLFYELSAPVC